MFAARAAAARAIRASTQRTKLKPRWLSTEAKGNPETPDGGNSADLGSGAASEPNSTDELLLAKDTEITELNEQLVAMKNNYLRGLADLENFRKRSAIEAKNAKEFGIQKFSKDLLSVADTMEMALKNAPVEEIEAGTNAPAKAMYEGMDGINKLLLKTFASHKLTQILPNVGEEFDPNLMEAQLEIPNPKQEPGTIAMVMRTGYALNERVLRAATVGVVKKH
eukprot:m.80949 g.80949  ORF g.80949 m.80949 type:complete len:223 (+) comp25365_c1_seq1:120-788(+)